MNISSIGKIITAPFSYSYLGGVKLIALIGIKGLVAILFVALFLMISVTESINEKSPIPVLKFVIGSLSASDNKIGEELDRFLALGSGVDMIDLMFFAISIFGSFYLIYIWFWIFIKWGYNLFGDQSAPRLQKFKWAFIVMILLNFIFSCIMWLIKISEGQSFDQADWHNWVDLFIPFVNVFRLIINIPYIVSFIHVNKTGMVTNLFNPDLRYNEGVSPENLGWLKSSVRWVINLPNYVGKNLALMKQELMVFKDWGSP